MAPPSHTPGQPPPRAPPLHVPMPSMHSSRSKLDDEAHHEHIELYHPTGSPVFGRSASAGTGKRPPADELEHPPRMSGTGTATSNTSTADLESESGLGHAPIADLSAPYGLRDLERGWQFFQPYLKAHGYALRPRYAPGWVGSWVGTGRDPLACEDSIVVDSTVIDAVRTADGAQVLLKVHTPLSVPGEAPALSPEIDILAFFAAEPRARDPRNHCVPLLDVLAPVPGGPLRISVMPLFRDWYAPPMRMAIEALAFVRQLLEGLAFMHAHHIAHCNITSKNILMDARALFPAGFHGAFNMNPAHRAPEAHLPQRSRLAAPVPVRYCFIDFALAVRVGEPAGAPGPGAEDSAARAGAEDSGAEDPARAGAEDGTLGKVKVKWRGGADVPEVGGRVGALYDPFKGDVYALGRVFEHFFVKGHTGLPALAPLIHSMLSPSPSARPSATQCLAHFDALALALPRSARRARLGFRVRVGWAEWCESVRAYVAMRWALCVGGARAGVLGEV
ncbi:hypothetical protein DENSPDRAFT_812250 [Dentipellis sp. KUC8613]|nr:hypothetical protein DENSPDRAFT_812250 [Dentipellis sp. KUC8613]